MPPTMAAEEDRGRITTMSVWDRTKARLDSVKITASQSYDETLNALLDYFESKGKRGEDLLRRQ